MADYFVARTRDCWLRVQLTGGLITSLCFGIRVTAPETKGGREHFTILEGINKGKKASVAAGAGQSFLTTNLRHGPAARRRQASLIFRRMPNPLPGFWVCLCRPNVRRPSAGTIFSRR